MSHRSGTFYEGFANRLREARRNSNLSLVGLSNRAGFSSASASKAYRLENDLQWPTDEDIHILASCLGVTPEFLKTGKEEEIKQEVKQVQAAPSDVLKSAYSNHEGYNDPTAAKAIAIAMIPNTNREFERGDIVYSDRNKYLVVNRFGSSSRYLVIKVDEVKSGDSEFICVVRDKDGNPYYINLLYFWSVDLSKGYRKKFSVSYLSYEVILSKFKRNFDFLGIQKKPVEEKAPDDKSIIFLDSVRYFLEKSGKECEVPNKELSLEEAVQLAAKVEVSMDDLLKDHTNDRKLDRVCQLEEELAKLKAEIGL